MPHIVKAGESIGPTAQRPVPDADGARIRWLVSSAHGGSEHGIIGELTLDPGAAQPLHRHTGVDEAIVVLEGHATLLTAAGEQPVPAGGLILAERQVWHGVRAGESSLKLLTIYAGESDIEALDTELSDGVADGALPATLDVRSLPRNPIHAPENGFFNMASRWLVSEDGLPSSAFLLGRAAYGEPEPEGGHALHRHLAGEEFLYLLEGQANHLTEDAEIAMRTGDLAFMPSPEWHGIWNSGPGAAQSVFGYLGVNSLAAGGYELYPTEAP
jgi:quercetin dioxygenase-like cupin family protein